MYLYQTTNQTSSIGSCGTQNANRVYKNSHTKTVWLPRFLVVFAGCARPDDSAKRIRESLMRLCVCIVYVLIMNSFVSFNLVWTSSLYNKICSQYTQDLLAFYRTWMKINILNVNKKTYFEHHEVMSKICLTNHKFIRMYIAPCFLLSIIEL